MSFSASERDREYYRNISEAHTFIERYLTDVEEPEFLADPKTQDAVIVWEVIKDFEEFKKLIAWARKNS